jgi:hypothetical protein
MKPNKIYEILIVVGSFTAIAAPMVTIEIDASAGETSTILTSETTSESAEVQLARYLAESGVQMFGAYWCPHCQHQKERFGKEAFQSIDYVECDPRGENPRPQLCQEEQIQGYPTWKIDGQLYPGDRSLEELADLSGYSGPRNFTSTQP